MKIYSVSAGSYSDWHIIGLFSSKEKAEQYIKDFKGVYYEINESVGEYELDPEGDPEHKGLTAYEVDIKHDGTIGEICQHWGDYYGDNHYFSNGILRVTCLGKDKDHAIKVANEKRAQLIAENKWKEDEEDDGWVDDFENDNNPTIQL